jgi:flagellar protein FliO/FliZ
VEIAFGDYLRFLFALIFVLGLIGGLALLGKRFGFGNRGPTPRGATKRLGIVETMALDPKRRIVLVRRDDTEHLILIGAAGEQVIESGIAPVPAAKSNALSLSLSKDEPAAPPHASTSSA